MLVGAVFSLADCVARTIIALKKSAWVLTAAIETILSVSALETPQRRSPVMTARLDVQDVAFAYRETWVFEHVSFSLSPGEVVGLVGPNGSGKSTLLRLLLGLLTPTHGRVLLDDRPIQNLSRKAIARQTAFVPQDTALDVAFRVRDIVAMGRNPYLGCFQPETPEDQSAIEWALTATATQSLAGRQVQELSGGERQRVMLARALAQQAPLLLLDEPTANLDVAHQLDMLSLVQSVIHDNRCA